MLPGDVDQLDPGEQDRRRPLIKLAATAGSAVKPGMEQKGRAQNHAACNGTVEHCDGGLDSFSSMSNLSAAEVSK